MKQDLDPKNVNEKVELEPTHLLYNRPRGGGSGEARHESDMWPKDMAK